jgi:hypothetical protein
MSQTNRDACAPIEHPGNAGAPYTWTEGGLWDRARSLDISGRSGLSREALAALVAERSPKPR